MAKKKAEETKDIVEIDNVTLQYSNTNRFEYTEEHFIIFFGKFVNGQGDTKQVEVLSKIAIPIERMNNFMGRLVDALYSYQKKYDNEIIPINVIDKD